MLLLRKDAVEFFCLLTFCIINFCSVGYCTYSHSVYTKESCNNVFTIVSLGLEEDSVVCDSGKCDGGVSCACCDILACTVQIICALCERIIVFEVGWKKAYQLTDLSKDLFFGFYSINKTSLFALVISCCCVTFLCAVSIKCVRAVLRIILPFLASMNVKSVSAGTTAIPPPQVPNTAVICGIIRMPLSV